ncbi:MAG: hypothetical protein H7707_03075 [Acetobacter sp.]|nr:hypothetical protein [Acetobacter sp.]
MLDNNTRKQQQQQQQSRDTRQQQQQQYIDLTKPEVTIHEPRGWHGNITAGGDTPESSVTINTHNNDLFQK